MNPILRTISNILNMVAPIVNILGVIAYCFLLLKGVFEVLCPMLILAIIGVFYGIIALKNNIPPRMFWFQKVNKIYASSFSIIIAYSIMFTLWAPLFKVFTLFI